MTYSVDYTRSTRRPYADWLERNDDAIFMYSEHRFDDIMRLFYIPHMSFIYIDVTTEYYLFKAVCEIKIFDKHIRIMSAVCANENIWPELVKGPPTATGGARFLYKNLEYFAPARILEKITLQMFGNDYSISIRKRSLMLSRELIAECQNWYDYMFYENGPWNRCVGTFSTRRREAATKIQAAYRGWRARMKYRYDPHTPLGRYVIGKLFENLI